MAAAADKKSTASLPLFMEAYGLEVEEELSTMATQYGQKEFGQEKRFQNFSGSWSKKQAPQRRSGSGKEVLLNIFSVEVNGTGAISA